MTAAHRTASRRSPSPHRARFWSLVIVSATATSFLASLPVTQAAHRRTVRCHLLEAALLGDFVKAKRALSEGADPNALYSDEEIQEVYAPSSNVPFGVRLSDMRGRWSRLLPGTSAVTNHSGANDAAPLLCYVVSAGIEDGIENDKGAPQMLALLLARGAKPNVTLNRTQLSPLQWASLTQSPTRKRATMRLLLAHGADPNARYFDIRYAFMAPRPNPHFRNETPLTYAITFQHDPAEIQLLLGAGADPVLADASGVTPLTAALKSGDKDATRLIRVAIAQRRATPQAAPGCHL